MQRILTTASTTAAAAVISLASASTFAGVFNPATFGDVTMTGSDGIGVGNDWTETIDTAGAWANSSTGDYGWGTDFGTNGTKDAGNFTVINPNFGTAPMIYRNFDPEVNVDFVVQNTSTVTLNMVFTFEIPIVAIAAPVTISGETAVTLTDTGGDPGASLAATSFYSGEIDGAGVQTIDISLGTPGNASGSFGPTALAATAANNTIAIVYNFSLTPGDTAEVTGRFTVVPEPSAMALIGLGTLLIARRRRV